jgi:hypothetical protein
MGEVRKTPATNVLKLIARHTKATPAPAPPRVIPPTSLWDKIRGRKSN